MKLLSILPQRTFPWINMDLNVSDSEGEVQGVSEADIIQQATDIIQHAPADNPIPEQGTSFKLNKTPDAIGKIMYQSISLGPGGVEREEGEEGVESGDGKGCKEGGFKSGTR